MPDRITTRYGTLGGELAQAVWLTITLATADAIAALADTHQAPRVPSAFPTPRRRWEQLLRNLFPGSTMLADPGVAPADLVHVPTGSEAEERTARRLISSAATFLLAESLENVVDDAMLNRVVPAARTLMDAAESGQWRDLLAKHVPPPR